MKSYPECSPGLARGPTQERKRTVTCLNKRLSIRWQYPKAREPVRFTTIHAEWSRNVSPSHHGHCDGGFKHECEDDQEPLRCISSRFQGRLEQGTRLGQYERGLIMRECEDEPETTYPRATLPWKWITRQGKVWRSQEKGETPQQIIHEIDIDQYG